MNSMSMTVSRIHVSCKSKQLISRGRLARPILMLHLIDSVQRIVNQNAGFVPGLLFFDSMEHPFVESCKKLDDEMAEVFVQDRNGPPTTSRLKHMKTGNLD